MTRLIGPYPNIDPSKASPSAQMWWVCHVATRLHILDEEVTEGWATGLFTDYDVLDNITSHGDLGALLSHRSDAIRQAAQVLSARVNNLLTGLLVNASGNFGC